MFDHVGYGVKDFEKSKKFYTTVLATLGHTLIADLKESVALVKANPGSKDGLAPVYGLAASLPFRGIVSDILRTTLDVVYKV